MVSLCRELSSISLHNFHLFLIIGLGVIILGGNYDDGYVRLDSETDSEPDYDYDDLVLEDGRSFRYPDKYNYLELRSSNMKWKISVYGNEEDVFSFRKEKLGDRENPIESMLRATTFKVSNNIANDLRNVDWEKYPGMKEDDHCDGKCDFPGNYPGSCGDTYCHAYLQFRAVLFMISRYHFRYIDIFFILMRYCI